MWHFVVSTLLELGVIVKRLLLEVVLYTFLAKVGTSELQASSMQRCVDFEQSDKVVLAVQFLVVARC
jgi:hypothetical protein